MDHQNEFVSPMEIGQEGNLFVKVTCSSVVKKIIIIDNTVISKHKFILREARCEDEPDSLDLI